MLVRLRTSTEFLIIISLPRRFNMMPTIRNSVEDLHRIAIQRYHEGSKTNMPDSESIEYIYPVVVGPALTGEHDLPIDSCPNWSPPRQADKSMVREDLSRINTCAYGQHEAEQPDHVLYVTLLSVETQIGIVIPVFPGIELLVRGLKLRWDRRDMNRCPILLDEEGCVYKLEPGIIVGLRKLEMRTFHEQWEAMSCIAED